MAIDMNKIWPNHPWRMSGTEGTFDYTVRAASARGRVGVRRLPRGAVRIRLELAPGLAAGVIKQWQQRLPRSAGYKQPGDNSQNRFSIVVSAGDHADAILAMMFGLLGQKEGLKSFTYNPSMDEPGSTANTVAV